MVQIEQDDTFRGVLADFVGTFLDQAGSILVDKYDEYVDHTVSFAGRKVSLLVFDKASKTEEEEPPVRIHFDLTSHQATIDFWRKGQGGWEMFTATKDFRDSDLFFDQTADQSSHTIAHLIEKVRKGQKL